MKKLEGRVAIITGAGRGQGEATARLFAAEGARVVIADVLETEGRAVAEAIGDQAVYQHLDVSDEAAWNKTVSMVTERWGGIDILVNNAAIVLAKSIPDTELADWNRVISINLTGAWLGIRATSPSMIARGKGAIVNISSMAGLIGMHGLVAYQASKWGIRGLSKAAAMELGHRGVRVNTIFPGGVNTAMGNAANYTSDQLSKLFHTQPIQRIGEPEEIAQTSLFLVSDEASYVHGAEIAVDGGRTVGSFDPHLPGGISLN